MKAAACIFVRNEQDFILEWIFHHLHVGFDTIIVMDSNSDDATGRIAATTSSKHDVRVGTWPDYGDGAKKDCYDFLLEDSRSDFDWMTFLDIDEFILPLRDRNVKAFLSKMGCSAAVALNWAVFGSNHNSGIQSDLVLESYVSRAEAQFLSNRHVKSIVRPSRVIRTHNDYVFELRDVKRRPSYDYVNSSNAPVVWSENPGITANDADLSICRINKYYTRSRQKFLAHGDRGDWKHQQSVEAVFDYNNRNEIIDLSGVPFARAVRALNEQVVAVPFVNLINANKLPTEETSVENTCKHVSPELPIGIASWPAKTHYWVKLSERLDFANARRAETEICSEPDDKSL